MSLLTRQSRSLSPSPPPAETKSPTRHLSDSQLRLAFSLLDTNKDGEINEEEFRTMLQNLGIEVDELILQQMIADIKKNGEFIWLTICGASSKILS